VLFFNLAVGTKERLRDTSKGYSLRDKVCIGNIIFPATCFGG